MTRKWIAPKRPGIPSDALPDPYKAHPTYRTNADFIRDLAAKANMPDQADALIGFVRDATRDYVRAQARDEAIAWPEEVKAFRFRVQEASRLLELNEGQPVKIARADRKEADPSKAKAKAVVKATRSEATILRSTSISPFAFEDVRELLSQLTADLDELIAGFGAPTKDSAVTPARQLALAERFWGAFTSNGWPTNTNPKGLMFQLCEMVLKAAGEKRVTIKGLLEMAKPNS